MREFKISMKSENGSINQIERLDNENAMFISNTLIPGNDTLRITYKDTPINVKFQTKKRLGLLNQNCRR